jgi:hypothetical protein
MPELPPKRPPPKPDRPPALDLQPERKVVHHDGVDGVAQPVPRKLTAPGGFAAVPPPLPSKGTPTVPAENPLQRLTVRRPTPPSAVAHARRSDPPPSKDAAPTDDAAAGQLGALLAENARLRSDKAKLERDARAAAEATVESYPPKVSACSPSPAPATRTEVASAPPDAAIGRTARWVGGKIWPFLVAAAGLGGGAVGIAKPTTDPAKTDAILTRLESIERKQDHQDAKLNGLLDREEPFADFVECVYEQQADYFAQLLPSQEHLTATQPLRVWVDRCRNRRPKR